MDVLHFLLERLRFVRNFYATASQPFRDIKGQIEAGEPPFDDPVYQDDGEPPYLTEWIDAHTSLVVFGRVCVTMLSQSLRLYFETWESELGIVWGDGERKRAFRKGYLRGYLYCFEEVLRVSWDVCPADLGIIEQVVLARNCDQHPENIASLHVKHNKAALRKHPNPIFISDIERRMLAGEELAELGFMAPAVEVSEDALSAAITEIEKLARWLEPLIAAKQWPASS